MQVCDRCQDLSSDRKATSNQVTVKEPLTGPLINLRVDLCRVCLREFLKELKATVTNFMRPIPEAHVNLPD